MICNHWVSHFGLGFHPDTRGADYVDGDGNPSLTEAARYDAEMERLFGLCAEGVAAMRRAGLL
jgi:hypothetical protein